MGGHSSKEKARKHKNKSSKNQVRVIHCCSSQHTRSDVFLMSRTSSRRPTLPNGATFVIQSPSEQFQPPQHLDDDKESLSVVAMSNASPSLYRTHTDSPWKSDSTKGSLESLYEISSLSVSISPRRVADSETRSEKTHHVDQNTPPSFTHSTFLGVESYLNRESPNTTNTTSYADHIGPFREAETGSGSSTALPNSSGNTLSVPSMLTSMSSGVSNTVNLALKDSTYPYRDSEEYSTTLTHPIQAISTDIISLKAVFNVIREELQERRMLYFDEFHKRQQFRLIQQESQARFNCSHLQDEGLEHLLQNRNGNAFEIDAIAKLTETQQTFLTKAENLKKRLDLESIGLLEMDCMFYCLLNDESMIDYSHRVPIHAKLMLQRSSEAELSHRIAELYGRLMVLRSEHFVRDQLVPQIRFVRMEAMERELVVRAEQRYHMFLLINQEMRTFIAEESHTRSWIVAEERLEQINLALQWLCIHEQMMRFKIKLWWMDELRVREARWNLDKVPLAMQQQRFELNNFLSQSHVWKSPPSSVEPLMCPWIGKDSQTAPPMKLSKANSTSSKPLVPPRNNFSSSFHLSKTSKQPRFASPNDISELSIVTPHRSLGDESENVVPEREVLAEQLEGNSEDASLWFQLATVLMKDKCSVTIGDDEVNFRYCLHKANSLDRKALPSLNY